MQDPAWKAEHQGSLQKWSHKLKAPGCDPKLIKPLGKLNLELPAPRAPGQPAACPWARGMGLPAEDPTYRAS